MVGDSEKRGLLYVVINSMLLIFGNGVVVMH